MSFEHEQTPGLPKLRVDIGNDSATQPELFQCSLILKNIFFLQYPRATVSQYKHISGVKAKKIKQPPLQLLVLQNCQEQTECNSIGASVFIPSCPDIY